MRHAILVLGMHRSGTSALSGALVHLGVTPPRTLMAATEENERGYFESFAFMVFHDEILAAAGSRWNDWRRLPFPYGTPLAASYRQRALQLLQEEFGDASLFVLKDPRACRLVPFWLDTLKHAAIEARVIIPVRPPLEVAKSLATRNGLRLEEGVALWLRHALDAERDSRHTRRSFILMDELLGDSRSSLDRIARELGLTWPKTTTDAALEVEAFLSPDLKHHQCDTRSPIVGWASDAFEAFAALARNPHSSPARSSLDVVGAAFEQACDLFGAFGQSPALVSAEMRSDISNDNVANGPREEAEAATSRCESDLRALQANTRELRDRLQGLREQTRIDVR